MDSGISWDSVKFSNNGEIDSIGLCKQCVDASLNLDDRQSKAGIKHIRFDNID